MFLKLLRHEFFSAGKWFFGLYAATLLASLFAGMNLKEVVLVSDSGHNVIAVIIFVALIISISISTLVLVIRRFFKNVYGREGYLTFTLPVNVHQIILAKLFAAFIWQLLSAMVILASFAIIILQGTSWREFLIVLPTIIGAINPVDIAIFVAYFSVSSLTGILMIYLAISIGQLFNDHRGIFAFVAYLVIYFVMVTFDSIFFSQNVLSSYITETGLDTNLFVTSTILSLGFGAICYLGTHYIMKHRLNIQ